MIQSFKGDLMTQGDPHEEAGRDEEVAEGEVHDGPLRILVSKCLQVSIESASLERFCTIQ
jgi:hypothetical protein